MVFFKEKTTIPVFCRKNFSTREKLDILSMLNSKKSKCTLAIIWSCHKQYFYWQTNICNVIEYTSHSSTRYTLVLIGMTFEIFLSQAFLACSHGITNYHLMQSFLHRWLCFPLASKTSSNFILRWSYALRTLKIGFQPFCPLATLLSFKWNSDKISGNRFSCLCFSKERFGQHLILAPVVLDILMLDHSHSNNHCKKPLHSGPLVKAQLGLWVSSLCRTVVCLKLPLLENLTETIS